MPSKRRFEAHQDGGAGVWQDGRAESLARHLERRGEEGQTTRLRPGVRDAREQEARRRDRPREARPRSYDPGRRRWRSRAGQRSGQHSGAKRTSREGHLEHDTRQRRLCGALVAGDSQGNSRDGARTRVRGWSLDLRRSEPGLHRLPGAGGQDETPRVSEPSIGQGRRGRGCRRTGEGAS